MYMYMYISLAILIFTFKKRSELVNYPVKLNYITLLTLRPTHL
jgi:hypothetical protein